MDRPSIAPFLTGPGSPSEEPPPAHRRPRAVVVRPRARAQVGAGGRRCAPPRARARRSGGLRAGASFSSPLGCPEAPSCLQSGRRGGRGPGRKEPGFLNPRVALALQPGSLHWTFRKQGPLGPVTEMQDFSCCMSLSCPKNLRKATSTAERPHTEGQVAPSERTHPNPGKHEGDGCVVPPEPSLLPGADP